MPTARANPYEQTYQSFLAQTKDHQLTVLHENGLYRHLRVQAPGTRIWSWDITTWPGHLATSGDVADGYMFTRTEDMMQFFELPASQRDYYASGAPCIDVRYWAEKLCGGRSLEVKIYDTGVFLTQVREELEEHEAIGTQADRFRERQIALLERIRQLRHPGAPTVLERLEAHWTGRIGLDELFDQSGLSQAEMDGLAAEFDHDENSERAEFDLIDLESSPVVQTPPAQRRHEILNDARWHSNSEHDAHTWLSENEEFVGCDTWEWDLRGYDVHFLFACYAIELTTRLYREHTTHTQEG